MSTSTLDAARRMCDHYPGGRAVMAMRLGKADETLRKELAGAAGFKFGLLDAVAISELCVEANSPHCHDLVNLIAVGSGRMVELQVREGPPEDVPGSLSALINDAGKTLGIGIEALRDGKVSDNELKAAERAIGDVMTDVQMLQVGLRKAHAASKPAALREVS